MWYKILKNVTDFCLLASLHQLPYSLSYKANSHIFYSYFGFLLEKSEKLLTKGVDSKYTDGLLTPPCYVTIKHNCKCACG